MAFAQLTYRESLRDIEACLCADLEQTVYALDSTTLDLCLALFPWAKFRRRKGAVKVHTQLDLRGNIPTFIRITDGKVHDVNFLDDLTLEAGAIYIMDRGYIDFDRLYQDAEKLSLVWNGHIGSYYFPD